ncbi:MAG: BatD family protein [Verrucomicrobiota bacterium]
MSIYAIRIHVFIVVAAIVASCGIGQAFADSPSITAVLSNSEAAVGETIELQIRATGGRTADAPEQIEMDGLEIRRTGTSQHFEMNNFNITSSVVYTYTILPLKAGTFKIPPQTIHIAGKSLTTPELALHVVDSSGSTARSNPGTADQPQRTAAGKLVFAELIVPKKSAFVGEMVPVQIRLGFDPRSRPRLIDGPEIAGQGFTAQKLQQSGERIETIDGRTYTVVSFKTAIAAARAGKFEIGPVKARVQVAVPRKSNSQSKRRSPFDLFDQDDPFSDPFFADPFGQMNERREVEMKSEAISFEVKPLPPKAPAQFSGAVGSFTMTNDVKPTSLQVGDPITVTSTIIGRGNFDRVNAPILEDERGWHKYPPSSKFKQDDDVGISGSKNFETVISPNEKKQAVPPFVFAYFDPAKENYITLRSDAVPVTVEGGNLPPPSVAAASALPNSSTPARALTPAAPVENKPADILYQLTEQGRPRSFTPLYAQPIFWATQIVPLIALLGFCGWKIRQSRIGNRDAQRVAALQNEEVDLLRKLRRADVSPREYYAEASRIVRVKTALASGSRRIDPNSVDIETAATAFELDKETRERLQRLFERSDELQYSGRQNGTETISGENRRDIMDLIENLRA